MPPVIRKATRRKAKLRLALLGPTGSGKTYSSLLLAFGIGKKIGIIDTENNSADLYSDLGNYDVITLDAPYTVVSYREAIRAFEDAGYDVIIIDSLSHAWSGAGGLLDKKSKLDAGGGNPYINWGKISPEQNALVDQILQSPVHMIVTMRVKMEYVLEKNDRGKEVPVKKGLQPVQRDGLEYEFTVVMDVDSNHVASTTKDRTNLFNGWADTITQRTGEKLLQWLNAGDDSTPKYVSRETPKPAAPSDEELIARLVGALKAAATAERVQELMDSDAAKGLVERHPDNSDLMASWTEALARAVVPPVTETPVENFEWPAPDQEKE